MKLSVIIPTHQRRSMVLAAVREYAGRIPPGVAAEIVVVDDGSMDGTSEALAELARDVPRLRAHRQPNAGLGAARNRGIELARGETLLFSDDDMLPESEDFVRRHLEAQAAAPGAWVGHLVVPETCATTPFQRYWRDRLHAGTARLPDGRDLGRGGFWFATLSIPAAMLGADRFAPEFTSYGWEEHELGYRLHRRGVRARFLRGARIEHHDAVAFEGHLAKYESMGEMAWVFHRLHPNLEVAFWTGVHPLSRAARHLLRHEARAARLCAQGRAHEGFDLCLEAAYARGLEKGRRARKEQT